jgi:hypothetical protein
MEDSFFKKIQTIFFQYLPLIVITLFALLLALGHEGRSSDYVYRFMGFFLCTFSLFKWIDIKGFTQVFQEYDLLAKIFKPYMFIYPAAEFIVGYGYIQLELLYVCNILTIVLMLLNGISISHALVKRKKLQCACLGTVVKLPLSVISLFESLLMLVMAAWML